MCCFVLQSPVLRLKKYTWRAPSKQTPSILPGYWQIQAFQEKTVWGPDGCPNFSLFLFCILEEERQEAPEKGKEKRVRKGTAWSTKNITDLRLTDRPLAFPPWILQLDQSCCWQSSPASWELLRMWKSILSLPVLRFLFSLLSLLLLLSY